VLFRSYRTKTLHLRWSLDEVFGVVMVKQVTTNITERIVTLAFAPCSVDRWYDVRSLCNNIHINKWWDAVVTNRRWLAACNAYSCVSYMCSVSLLNRMLYHAGRAPKQFYSNIICVHCFSCVVSSTTRVCMERRIQIKLLRWALFIQTNN